MKTTTLMGFALACLTACSSADDTAETADVGGGPTTQPAAPAALADTPAPPPPTPTEVEPAAGGEATAPVPRAGGSTPPASSPPPGAVPADSATRILEQASAKYREIRSLQADFSMVYENPLLRSRTEGAGTLYQKRPDRLLLRFSDPAGDVVLSDGEYFWIFYPSVDPGQVVRSPASEGGASGVDLQAQFLGDPTRRFNYRLDGEEAVAGRRVWLLTLTPRERTGYRQLRVWIDQADHLARRFEITEDNGALRRFELRNVRVNPTLGDALFRFDPPAGVRVITR